MQYTTITAAACTAAFALSGMASADIQVPLRVLNSTYDASRPFSALLGTGYATKYVSRGLAFQQSGSDHVVPVEAIGAYDLNKKYSILAGVKYQWLTQNDLTHNSTGISDEATALLGVSRKFSDYTMASLGYQFVNGGLPGLMNVHLGQTSSDFPAFEHSRSEEHSFVLDIHHDFGKGLENFFWDCRVQYTFRWMSGWWFTNTLGYKYDFNPSSSLIVAGTWNASAGYFDRDSLNANGTQGISVTVAVPFKAVDRLVLTPFVSTVCWATEAWRATTAVLPTASPPESPPEFTATSRSWRGWGSPTPSKPFNPYSRGSRHFPACAGSLFLPRSCLCPPFSILIPSRNRLPPWATPSPSPENSSIATPSTAAIST